jgi:flagellar basal-body rod modification protein FlgD
MIGAVGSAGGTGAPGSTGTGVGTLSSGDFLKLMIAQLQYQDPFQPMDTSAMMQQTSSLTSVQTLQEMSALQSELLGMQQANTATSLIGKQVTAVDTSGATLSGVVSGVSYTATGPQLQIGTQEVPLGQVSAATNPTQTPAATTSSPGNGTPA